MGWIGDILKDIPLSTVLKEKIAAIEEKYKELETKYSVLEIENADLKRQLAESNTNASVFEQQVNQLTHSELLDEIKQKILLSLGRHKSLTSSELQSLLQTQAVVIDFHLQELEDSEHIDCHYNIRYPSQYVIAQKGRQYLLANKLL